MIGFPAFLLFFFAGVDPSGTNQPTVMTATIELLPGDPDPTQATIVGL